MPELTELETQRLIREQLAARVVDLDRKREARAGMAGFSENTQALAQTIEVLTAEIETRDAQIAALEAEPIGEDQA